jgi:hypothetical protein
VRELRVITFQDRPEVRETSTWVDGKSEASLVGKSIAISLCTINADLTGG